MLCVELLFTYISSKESQLVVPFVIFSSKLNIFKHLGGNMVIEGFLKGSVAFNIHLEYSDSYTDVDIHCSSLNLQLT